VTMSTALPGVRRGKPKGVGKARGRQQRALDEEYEQLATSSRRIPDVQTIHPLRAI